MDCSISILEIGVGGCGPKVHPFANVSVSNKARVILVCVTLNDCLFQLTPHPTDRANAAALPNQPGRNNRLVSYVRGTADSRARMHNRFIAYEYRTISSIKCDMSFDMSIPTNTHIFPTAVDGNVPIHSSFT